MASVTIRPNDRLLDQYYKTLKELRDQQKVSHEGGTRRVFSALLTGLGRRRKLSLVEEYARQARNSSKHIRVDGALIDTYQRPFAYWEAKDSRDNLDAEIQKKIDAGYPLNNIIFEDTRTAVLYQDDREADRVKSRESPTSPRC